jgi:hypothetical protein
MSESGDAGILSLPEEVLIKIAQHLGKKARTYSSSVADRGLLSPNLDQTLLNPDTGFDVLRYRTVLKFLFLSKNVTYFFFYLYIGRPSSQEKP